MSFKTIFGQPLAVELAQRWLARRTTQPLLLYGPEGVGKRALALEIAKALNCLEGAGNDSCGHCRSCRNISSGSHPDVRVLGLSYQALERGEPLEKQQFLRIETIQEERRRLHETAVEGSWKISLLDDAHRLTLDAANVLLKILEEPPPRTAIFLVTPHRDRLVATVASRCQPLRFRSLAPGDLQRFLSQRHIADQSQKSVVDRASGSPGRALRMLQAASLQAGAEAEKLWQALPQLSPDEILAQSPVRGKSAAPYRALMEDNLAHLLEIALRTLRAGQREAASCVELIQKAQQQLRRNVQPGLVYDHLLLQISKYRQSSVRRVQNAGAT